MITALTYPPSRATDAEVARALGWRDDGTGAPWYPPGEKAGAFYSPWRYTCDKYEGWAAMREMVAWLAVRGYPPTLSPQEDGWEACHKSWLTRTNPLYAVAPTLPHAVALLVLMARDAEERAAKGEDANG